MQSLEVVLKIRDKKELEYQIEQFIVLLEFNENRGIVDEKLIGDHLRVLGHYNDICSAKEDNF